MTDPTITYGFNKHPLVEAFEHAREEAGYVMDVKTDLNFINIFSNLIKKMDEGSQAAVQ